jgi:2',3'-cyclic-nucleotide 2'-phosphodiesterase (5'-nucleotidase family)
VTQRAVALLAVVLAACTGLPPAPEPINPIRFLLVNDVYVVDTLADGHGGVARVATVRNRLAAEGPVLFVLAGDVLSPSLLSKYYNGRQMVDVFNAAGLDYATFGNHEFELARDTLVARIGESKFRWLSANCVEANGKPFPGVLAWDTVRVLDQKVGIFGLTLQGDYRKYVRCGSPDSAATAAIDTLARLGADLIVGLTHQSLAAERAVVGREGRLSIVLGGHEHEAHTVTVSGRSLLKADANSRTAQFATLWGGKGQWRQATSLVEMHSGVPLDSTVARIAAAWTDSLRRRLGPEQVIGTAPEPIDARDGPLRRRETVFGDLVTDAIRAGTGADVALLNSGTLRLDDVVGPGPVTNYQLEAAFLFSDEARVVTFPLSGARLREILEQGVGERSLGRGAFLQVSGVRFIYDSTRATGARIQGGLKRPDGRAIAPGDTLRTAMVVYPACEGGDEYSIPEAGDACRSWQQGPRSVDLLVRYVQDSLGGMVRSEGSGRIVAK